MSTSAVLPRTARVVSSSGITYRGGSHPVRTARRQSSSSRSIPRTLLQPPLTPIVSARPDLKAHASSDVATTKDEHWMDFLRYDSNPTFDVIQKTKEYSQATASELPKYWAEDYVFRGPVVGPITGYDVQATQTQFNIMGAYPDLKRESWGFSVDPKNPYCCMYFERWTGTHTGDLKVGPITLPATGKKANIPTHVFRIHWNPEGKIVYTNLSAPLDRFEGNTKGTGAIFALLANAGLPTNGGVGDTFTILTQHLNMAIPGGAVGKAWSEEKDIPSWWKSKARGADPNDI